MAKTSKVKLKKQSILAKVKLFFEEIPDTRAANKKKQVSGRTLQRSKKR
ncbi:MAG TPA: hypothetical protein PKA29_00805 [Candidatus Saccharibacteria bacterium]|nr:hypothetical protein [Candidatus Saccharibacteria bacterium]